MDPLRPSSLPRPCELLLQTLNELPPDTITWLWSQRLALGKLSLLDRDPGLGPGLSCCSFFGAN